MVAFVLGLFAGAFIGIFIMSMCAMAKQSEHRILLDTSVESVEERRTDGKD